MIRPECLEILVCPEDRSRLQMADETLLANLNDRIHDGTLKNLAGESVTRPLKAGLVREDGAIFYPIVDDIPVLLVDESFDLKSLGLDRPR